MDKYLSVIMFQLHYMGYDDGFNVYNSKGEVYEREMRSCINLIKIKRPDISMFPEMSYDEKFAAEFTELSKNAIIIAGSHYVDGNNVMVIFQNGVRRDLIKRFPSGKEVMSRHVEHLSHEEFLEKYINDYRFRIKGKDIYVFNCFEFFQIATFVARATKNREKLFGIFAICANSNTPLFEQEAVSIHNHNERVYTFVVNTIGADGATHGDGSSFIYGPVSNHEKSWLKKTGIESKPDVAMHVLSLSTTDSEYAYGEFSFYDTLSRFARSDYYQSNPKNVEAGDL